MPGMHTDLHYVHNQEVYPSTPVNVAELSHVGLEGAVIREGIGALLQGALLGAAVLPLAQHGQVAVCQGQCQPGRSLWRHGSAV